MSSDRRITPSLKALPCALPWSQQHRAIGQHRLVAATASVRFRGLKGARSAFCAASCRAEIAVDGSFFCVQVRTAAEKKPSEIGNRNAGMAGNSNEIQWNDSVAQAARSACPLSERSRWPTAILCRWVSIASNAKRLAPLDWEGTRSARDNRKPSDASTFIHIAVYACIHLKQERYKRCRFIQKKSRTAQM
jgi:hypothetical protein